ncbi:MAG TPA: CTP synthase (glutamine hydrolyzing) [bacterium]|nr:CTP synthase (glutamine hydrolyzing) [bacterium]HOL47027.1 CTP synthase (glutamine hydrolyzing) [bacterium]HPQ18471.1 CTP synthase (glutamine hydrolyzing) [bacterium]
MKSQKSKKTRKYIVITGGVLSGLGKGIATASIGRLLASKLKIIPIKCDGYLNTDPGTMNPIEHGEVFVLDDGGEVDMDFGHYERFLNINCKFGWNLTMGKIFKSILEKERRGEFLGKTVQYIPHVTNEIKNKIYEIAEKENADLVLIEIGGTVGDMENELYLEAVRQLRLEIGEENIIFIHLTYIPIMTGVEEQKSKPTQQSVKLLQEKGIEPDIIIGRCKEYITEKIKEKIALFCNVEKNCVISGIDVNTVYEIPIIYEKEGLSEIIHKKLNIYSPPNLEKWKKYVEKIKNNKNQKKIKIAICGKYTSLGDSYASIIETLNHCRANLDVFIEIKWIDTTDTNNNFINELSDVNGIIVPGGFGVRGLEGKISIIKYARENNIPFLGICLGMQLAVIEFARNVCGIKDAHTTEILSEVKEKITPIIDLLPEQKKVENKGGSMRLGGQNVYLKKGSLASKIYGKDIIRMRFRHRYEVNPEYIKQLEKNGLIFSGYTKDKRIMQILELKEHKYFIGCQFHPELTSRLEKPDPFFLYLIKNCIE